MSLVRTDSFPFLSFLFRLFDGFKLIMDVLFHWWSAEETVESTILSVLTVQTNSSCDRCRCKYHWVDRGEWRLQRPGVASTSRARLQSLRRAASCQDWGHSIRRRSCKKAPDKPGRTFHGRQSGSNRSHQIWVNNPDQLPPARLSAIQTDVSFIRICCRWR